MPTLKQRGKSWVLDWYDQSGGRRQTSIGKIDVLSVKEAKHILRLKELELDTGKNLLDHAPQRGTSLHSYCQDRYLPWHANEYPSSHVRVDQIFRDYLLPHFRQSTLSAIDVSAVDAYKVLRNGKAAPATIGKEVRQLKAALNKAVEWKLIKGSEAKHAKPPKDLEGGEVHFYTAEQLQMIYAHAKKYGRWAPYWKFLANTGLRRGELARLWRRDVKGGQVFVRSTNEARTKSGKSRVIPMSPGALEAWEEMPANADNMVLAGISPHMLSVRFKRHAEQAGVGGSIHWLRHTFISHLVMQGRPLRVVQELAGHASITTTEGYAHLAPGFMDNAVGELRI